MEGGAFAHMALGVLRLRGQQGVYIRATFLQAALQVNARVAVRTCQHPSACCGKNLSTLGAQLEKAAYLGVYKYIGVAQSSRIGGITRSAVSVMDL